MTDEPTAAADLRLIESEQRYQAVIENASDMIQSVLPDGTFEFVNGAWRRTLGWDDDDLAKMIVWDIIPEHAMDHCQREFTRAMDGRPIALVETWFLAKDGHEVPVEGSVTSRMLGDTVVATHGFFRDVSERLRADELEARTVRLERDERARYLEKMAALGKLSAGLAHELNNPAAAIQRAAGGLQDTMRRRDAALRALLAEDIGVGGFLAIDDLLRSSTAPGDPSAVDPVDRADREEELETWLEDHGIAEAWQTAPALADAGVSPEGLESVSRGVPETSLPCAVSWITESLTAQGTTEIIRHGTHRISDLVSAIKGYSHMDRATEHVADIHEGIEDTLVMLGHRLRNVEVERSYDRSLPTIPTFGNSLNQVWTNLLDNAIDAVDGHGRVRISTSASDAKAVIEVEDDGEGIPPDALPRIFEPFFTSKEQGVGTGLGLDTVWRIVTEQHNGTIEAQSTPGHTVFRVALPLPSTNGQPEGGQPTVT